MTIRKREFFTAFILNRARGCAGYGTLGINAVFDDAEAAWQKLQTLDEVAPTKLVREATK